MPCTPEGLSNNLTSLPVLKERKIRWDSNPGRFNCVIEKGTEGQIKEKITIAENLMAPVEENQTVGEIRIRWRERIGQGQNHYNKFCGKNY